MDSASGKSPGRMPSSRRAFVDECNRQAESLLGNSPSHAMQLARSSASLAEQVRHVAGAAQAYWLMGRCASDMGEELASAQHFRTALSLARRAKLRELLQKSLLGLGSALSSIGDLQGAFETFNEYFDGLDESDPPERTANALNNVALSLFRLERYDDALAYYERSLAIHAGNPWARARVLLNMALAYGAQGRLDEAEALVDEIVGLAESAQARTTAALAEANFGEALMQAGRLDEAEARLLHALDLSGAAGELAARLVAHGALADVYLRQGRTQIARDQVRLSLQIARGQQRKYPLGDLLDIASRIEAAAGQWEEAYAFRSEQVACDRELARERLKLLTHYSADRLGIRAAAAGPRRRPPAEDGVDAAAAAQQTSAPAAPAEPLSPQQQRVLHLLAQGQSNKRIAANLGLSPLTVRHHVSEILARLGVRTRTEAAALAARLPDRQAP